MSAETKREPFVAYMADTGLASSVGQLWRERTGAENAVLVLPIEGEPPPVWPVGTKVRGKRSGFVLMVGRGDIHRDPTGAWRFYCDATGFTHRCEDFEPVPPEKTWELTGGPVRHARQGGGPVLILAPTREAALAQLDEMLVEVSE